MNARPQSRIWFPVIASLILIAAVPVLANHYRSRKPAATSDSKCSVDGRPIDAAYRVSISTSAKEVQFCCLRCAQDWLQRNEGVPLRQVLVVDEELGKSLPAAAAFYVRSPVVTNVQTGNRIHVFASAQAANHHVRTFGGQLLPYDSRTITSHRDDERSSVLPENPHD